MNEEFSTTCHHNSDHRTCSSSSYDDFAESTTVKSLLSTKRKQSTLTSSPSSLLSETFSPFPQRSPKKWRKTPSLSLQLSDDANTSTSSPNAQPTQTSTTTVDDDVDFYEIFRRLETQQQQQKEVASTATATSTSTTKFVELSEHSTAAAASEEPKVWKRVLDIGCVTIGCDRLQIYAERGLCHPCYMRSRYAERKLGIANTKRTVYDEVDREELLELLTQKTDTNIVATMAGVCCFTNCESAPYLRSLCKKHYSAALRLRQKKNEK